MMMMMMMNVFEKVTSCQKPEIHVLCMMCRLFSHIKKTPDDRVLSHISPDFTHQINISPVTSPGAKKEMSTSSSRRSTWRGSARYEQMSPEERQREIERVREANRIHCKETRDRKREKERLLREEVEVLTLYKSIVEDGPDLFSLHNATSEAPFSFLCENFYQRLQVTQDDILGRPLASIVDARYSYALRSAVCQVLDQGGRFSAGGREDVGSSGLLVQLRVVCRGVSCEASMTIVRGSHGVIIVTRLYDP